LDFLGFIIPRRRSRCATVRDDQAPPANLFACGFCRRRPARV